MKKYVALLRGINVSGQKKIKMAELREQLKSCGFENIESYIQSGNILFYSVESDKTNLNYNKTAIMKNKNSLTAYTATIVEPQSPSPSK